MSIKVVIDENKIDNFSAGARATMEEQLDKYAEDIIKEANLIEEVLRENGATNEITSNTVLQAVRKNKTHPPKKSNRVLLAAKIISTISAFVTGLLFDVATIQENTNNLIWFCVALIVVCISTMMQFILEYKD